MNIPAIVYPILTFAPSLEVASEAIDTALEERFTGEELAKARDEAFRLIMGV